MALVTIIYAAYFISIVRKQKSLNNQNLFRILVLLLFLFAALRGNGDVDYFNYKKYSLNIVDLNSLFFNYHFIEFGFRLISYINNLFNLDSQFVIITMNAISLGCFYRIISQYSKNRFISLIIFLPFFFQLDMHSARTAVAVSIGLFSFKALEEEKYLNYALSIFGAFLFHKSALVLLIPLFLNNKYVINFISDPKILFYILGLWIFKYFISVIEQFIRLLRIIGLDSFGYKAERYMDSSFAHPFSLFDPRLILAITVFTVLVFIHYKKYQNENHVEITLDIKKKRFLELILIYAFTNVFLLIFFSDATIFAVRFAHYYNIYMCISIPLIYFLLGEIYNLDIIKKYQLWTFNTLLMIVYIAYTIQVMPSVPYRLYLFNLI